MHVTRFAQAQEYQAPNHFDMRCLRLQGHAASETRQMWMGLSLIAPGGHTGLDGSPIEKLYFVVEGELRVVGETATGERTSHLLSVRDSCVFLPGEKRQLVNESDQPAAVLLVMANAPPQ